MDAIITFIIVILGIAVVGMLGVLILKKNTKDFSIRISYKDGFEISGSFFETHDIMNDRQE